MLTPQRSSSPVIVMISSMSVPMCNRLHATQANSDKTTTFAGYPYLTPACARLFEPNGSVLKLLKSTFNSKNFISRLSWSNSSRFGAIYS